MKISDAAKLLGISTDTIRYYEKEGVITPKRTSKNNYRDLDNRDIISLLICIYNRKIGYSMKESVEYVEGIPVSKITDILNKKIDELELEVKETKNLINYLTTLKMESEIDFYNIGNYWITVEPKCYLLPYAKISQSEICFTKDNPRYYAKLFEYLPFINQAQVTNVENICDFPQSVTEWFFVIPEIIYNQIPQEFLEDAKVMPRRHCLNTVVINEDWEYPNTEIFRDIFNYLKKHNIKSCGIVTATYPNYYFQESGKKVRYAKVKSTYRIERRIKNIDFIKVCIFNFFVL